MKTTFDLPEDLVREVKKLARERGTTARAIVQQSLTRTLAEQEELPHFVLTDASTTGWQTMDPEFRGLSLHELVLKSYDERG
jgi:hypothetical protein